VDRQTGPEQSTANQNAVDPVDADIFYATSSLLQAKPSVD
jgi:hypothetical protein